MYRRAGREHTNKRPKYTAQASPWAGKLYRSFDAHVVAGESNEADSVVDLADRAVVIVLFANNDMEYDSVDEHSLNVRGGIDGIMKCCIPTTLASRTFESLAAVNPATSDM